MVAYELHAWLDLELSSRFFNTYQPPLVRFVILLDPAVQWLGPVCPSLQPSATIRLTLRWGFGRTSTFPQAGSGPHRLKALEAARAVALRASALLNAPGPGVVCLSGTPEGSLLNWLLLAFYTKL